MDWSSPQQAPSVTSRRHPGCSTMVSPTSPVPGSLAGSGSAGPNTPTMGFPETASSFPPCATGVSQLNCSVTSSASFGWSGDKRRKLNVSVSAPSGSTPGQAYQAASTESVFQQISRSGSGDRQNASSLLSGMRHSSSVERPVTSNSSFLQCAERSTVRSGGLPSVSKPNADRPTVTPRSAERESSISARDVTSMRQGSTPAAARIFDEENQVHINEAPPPPSE